MKIRTSCCLGLLMIIGFMATAQQVASASNPCLSGTAVIAWVRFRLNPCHTAFNQTELVLSPATVGNLVVKWHTPLGGDSSPAVVKQ
ncbi:MAG: hypothetical protein ABSG32_32280 [Terriglobia bacterium]|jgi:hypothetical protein